MSIISSMKETFEFHNLWTDLFDGSNLNFDLFSIVYLKQGELYYDTGTLRIILFNFEFRFYL